MREKSAFLEMIGDTPFTRLLDFLITGRNFDYTLSDLARKAGISWTTLNRTFPKLVEQGIVVKTRQVGVAKLYRLNTENFLVAKLVDLYMGVLAERLRRAGKEHAIKAVTS
ncbi:MAG: hypothetical protein V1702_06415 [Candidatus Woesearchaeota archaeon]